MIMIISVQGILKGVSPNRKWEKGKCLNSLNWIDRLKEPSEVFFKKIFKTILLLHRVFKRKYIRCWTRRYFERKTRWSWNGSALAVPHPSHIDGQNPWGKNVIVFYVQPDGILWQEFSRIILWKMSFLNVNWQVLFLEWEIP